VAEVPSQEVGLAILRPLRELDEVAYLRFASVYRAFTSVEDFEKEITDLRARHHTGGTPPLPGMQLDPPAPRRRGGRTQPAPPGT
jgi:transcriptional repressor NrdR